MRGKLEQLNKNKRSQLSYAAELLDKARETVDQVHEDEQYCFDKMPENLAYSEKGEAMEDAINALEDAISSIDEAKEYIMEAME